MTTEKQSTATTSSLVQLTEETIQKPICFIPARAGSKRLPHKNKLPLNGKPLVQYAIEAARESGCFETVIVSSDDKEILELAYEQNVRPHKRPDGLRGGKVELRALVRFLLTIYGFPTMFALLQPTNPFITKDVISKAYKQMFDTDANYVMTVEEFHPTPYIALKEQGFLFPIFPDIVKQKHPILYRFNGGLIFAKTHIFLQEYDKNWYGSKVLPFYMSRTVDIDTKEDFEFAEWLMGKHGVNEKNR